MELQFYEPTGISHPTSVDFSKRSINQPVHLVQYDKSLPILAVSLYNNGQLYPLPDDAIASIRLGKPDKTFVYNRALGCNSNRTIVYFEVTQQMTLIEGEYYPIVEITREDKIANSSSIYIIIDRNPIQRDYIESTIECKELVDFRNEALTAAHNAKISEDNAKSSETNASNSASNASQSEQNAATSASQAKSSEENAAIDAKLSQSYAVGGSGVRDGEDTDNSKYYKEQAELSATQSSNLLEDIKKEHTDTLKDIEDAVSGKIADFKVDLETGHLLYTGGAFNFHVNNGHLNWEVAI